MHFGIRKTCNFFSLQACVICGLSWPRHSYGHHVERRCCYGCCSFTDRLVIHSKWLVLYKLSSNVTVLCCYTYDSLCFLVFLKAGNESCPQPQTSEHLAAIEIMKLKHIIILQNKIDLVKESQAKEQYDQILKFVQGKIASRGFYFHNRKKRTYMPVSCVECHVTAVPKCVFVFFVNRNNCRGSPCCPNLCSAQVQHRSYLWIYLQEDSCSRQRFHVRC